MQKCEKIRVQQISFLVSLQLFATVGKKMFNRKKKKYVRKVFSKTILNFGEKFKNCSRC